MTSWISSLDDLHALYGTPKSPAVRKVTPRLTPSYRAWIERSRFCILSTIGPEGTDGSPRGDLGPVVTVADDETLLMPDWQGNERLDSLRNILRDPRISLIFLIPGSTTAIRVNGAARLTADADMRQRFADRDKLPRSVIVIRIAEVYSQCAKAIQRAALWTSGDQSAGLPSAGQMLDDATSGEIDAATYDAERATRAHLGWW